MRRKAQARNPYSRSWLWIPGSFASLTPRNDDGRSGTQKLQSQHRLGDDVALDLVGAAIDRDLAVVEIARRDLRGPVHRLVGAVVAVLVVGGCERADHLHQQLGRGLL